MKVHTLAGALLAACLPLTAAAHGALAIGLPDDVAKKGVAIGYSYNYSSREEAEARAMKECASFMDAPPDTRELCRIVERYSNECVVIALDPDPGTPGVGWAIGGRSAASQLAMQRCVETAGEARKGFCKVMDVRCDETK